MYVRLTRKLAEMLDGVDVSRVLVGDVIEVSPSQGIALIAEGWAERTLETQPPASPVPIFSPFKLI